MWKEQLLTREQWDAVESRERRTRTIVILFMWLIARVVRLLIKEPQHITEHEYIEKYVYVDTKPIYQTGTVLYGNWCNQEDRPLIPNPDNYNQDGDWEGGWELDLPEMIPDENNCNKQTVFLKYEFAYDGNNTGDRRVYVEHGSFVPTTVWLNRDDWSRVYCNQSWDESSICMKENEIFLDVSSLIKRKLKSEVEARTESYEDYKVLKSLLDVLE